MEIVQRTIKEMNLEAKVSKDKRAVKVVKYQKIIIFLGKAL